MAFRTNAVEFHFTITPGRTRIMGQKLIFYIIIFCSVLALSNGQLVNFPDDIPEAIKDSETVKKDWDKMENSMKDIINEGIKMLYPIIMNNLQDTNVSSTCIRECLQIVAGLRKLKDWAVSFVDASAKSIDGLLSGSVFFLGAYDQCLDTVVLDQRSGKRKDQVMFTGKHCILRIKPSLPPKKRHFKQGEIREELQDIYKKGTIFSRLAKNVDVLYDFPLRIGICVPSGCSVDDINNMIQKVSAPSHLHMKVRRCDVKKDLEFTPIQIAVMFIYSAAGFMVLLGTLVDISFNYYGRQPNSIFIRVLLAFSFTSNFRKLMDTSTSSKSLSCLNGIRFITMSWVIVGHWYMLALRYVVGGLEYAREMTQDFALQVIVNPIVAVDTFFFLGGLLVCYVATKNVIIAKRKFSIKLFILHRFLRILPVYIFVILFIFLSDILISGPASHDILEPYRHACEENWWTNLLFVNIYYRANNMCLPHSWYMSVDLQFYIGSLLILLPLFRWPKAGVTLAFIFLIGFTIASAVVTYLKDFPPSFLILNTNMEEMLAFATQYYFMPYPHVGPYVTGLLTGYLLAMKPSLKIPKVFLLLGWSLSIISSISVIYGPYEWNRGKEITFFELIFYSGLHKVVWSLSVAWVVICCSTGYGGVVNYILSWKVWIPLGRLTFIAYLVHPLVQLTVIAGMSSPIDPKHVIAVWLYFGHFVGTYAIAFAGSLLIESPFLSLEKILFSRPDDTVQNKYPKDSNSKASCVTAEVGNDSCLELSNRDSNEHGNENPVFVHKL